MAEGRNDSVFFKVLSALRGGRKTIAIDQSTQRSVISGVPMPKEASRTTQQMQQDFLDVQSVKIAHDLYSRSVYYDADRITSYQDYRAMDLSPEVAAALDIMSDEITTRNEKGDILAVYSENVRVKKILQDLFSNVLNIDFNLSYWAREFLKFGDMFLKLEIDQKQGIYDARMLPPSEIHREEGWDGNVNSSRFRWETNSMYFEEWQVAHFRIPGDGSKLPYGTSVLAPARKLWKQLQLCEDAMLVYRLVRAPERRIYYIEVGNLDPADIPQYIEKVKREIKKSPVVNESTGNVNFKFNALPVWKNTPIPLLDGRTITIEELANEYDSGKENYVYSVQDKTHHIVPGKVVWCGKNYTANQLTKVWLDDGTWVLTAPEHPFVMRDGSKVEAKDLKEGDSLMPYYESEKKIFRTNYKQVYNPHSGKYEFAHRLIGKEVSKENDLYNTIHHKDFNRYNNVPTNLQWVDFNEHKKMHSEMSKRMWEDQEYKTRMSKIVSESQKEKWKDDEYRKNHSTKTSKTLRKKWDDGELEHVRESSINNMIAWNKSDDKKRRVSDSNKQRDSIKHMRWYNDSELHESHNENRSTAMSEMWNDPLKKAQAKSSMTIKVDSYCFDIMVKKLIGMSDFLNSELFFKSLVDTEMFDALVRVNPNSKRNLKSFFNSKANLLRILRENGIDNYEEFIVIYNPFLLQLKKEKYSKSRISWNENNLSRNDVGQFEYKNHKVTKIETIFENEDVYCMTIVGINGENDRHNFALYSFNTDGSCSNSGVFVKNTHEEDYFLPIRGDKSSRVETLPGASNLSDIADVEYLQNKLFAALKVPKPYLNYAETIPGGSALAQADLRFSRTINRLQEAIVIELRRVANIHLFFLGFEDDLDNFKLALTNPSTQQELLKLEVMKARIEVFKEMFTNDATSPVSYTWAMQYIMGFSESEIKQILRQKKVEKKMFSEIDQAIDEYVETGIFSELDSKFRRPGFIPGQAPATPPEDGAEAAGGGGGFGGGGTLGGLGGGGGGLGAPEAAIGPETGAETAGAEAGEVGTEAGEEIAPEALAENTKLLKKNSAMQAKTKILLENMEKKIQALNPDVEDDNSESN